MSSPREVTSSTGGVQSKESTPEEELNPGLQEAPSPITPQVSGLRNNQGEEEEPYVGPCNLLRVLQEAVTITDTPGNNQEESVSKAVPESPLRSPTVSVIGSPGDKVNGGTPDRPPKVARIDPEVKLVFQLDPPGNTEIVSPKASTEVEVAKGSGWSQAARDRARDFLAKNPRDPKWSPSTPLQGPSARATPRSPEVGRPLLQLTSKGNPNQEAGEVTKGSLRIGVRTPKGIVKSDTCDQETRDPKAGEIFHPGDRGSEMKKNQPPVKALPPLPPGIKAHPATLNYPSSAGTNHQGSKWALNAPQPQRARHVPKPPAPPPAVQGITTKAFPVVAERAPGIQAKVSSTAEEYNDHTLREVGARFLTPQQVVFGQDVGDISAHAEVPICSRTHRKVIQGPGSTPNWDKQGPATNNFVFFNTDLCKAPNYPKLLIREKGGLYGGACMWDLSWHGLTSNWPPCMPIQPVSGTTLHMYEIDYSVSYADRLNLFLSCCRLVGVKPTGYYEALTEIKERRDEVTGKLHETLQPRGHAYASIEPGNRFKLLQLAQLMDHSVWPVDIEERGGRRVTRMSRPMLVQCSAYELVCAYSGSNYDMNRRWLFCPPFGHELFDMSYRTDVIMFPFNSVDYLGTYREARERIKKRYEEYERAWTGQGLSLMGTRGVTAQAKAENRPCRQASQVRPVTKPRVGPNWLAGCSGRDNQYGGPRRLSFPHGHQLYAFLSDIVVDTSGLPNIAFIDRTEELVSNSRRGVSGTPPNSIPGRVNNVTDLWVGGEDYWNNHTYINCNYSSSCVGNYHTEPFNDCSEMKE